MSDGRYEFDTPEYCRVLYRGSKMEEDEFLDIYVKLICPACPDDEEDYGRLRFTEEDEIVADCPKCGYHARVSVYEEE